MKYMWVFVSEKTSQPVWTQEGHIAAYRTRARARTAKSRGKIVHGSRLVICSPNGGYFS